MIGVSVRKENYVNLRNRLERLRAHGIRHDPGIDKRNLSRGRRQRKRAVAEIGDLVALQVEHGSPLQKNVEDCWADYLLCTDPPALSSAASSVRMAAS